MATSIIRITVDDSYGLALLKKLNKEPGVIHSILEMDEPKKKPHEPAPDGGDTRKPIRGGNKQVIMALLMKGPTEVSTLFAQLGGKKGSVYTTLNQLKNEKLVKRVGPGLWALTDKASKGLNKQIEGKVIKPLALPKPHATAAVKHTTPSGRAPMGTGPKLLLQAIAEGVTARADIIKRMTAGGISPKGASGVFERAKRDGLIKATGIGIYALTAKATKQTENAAGADKSALNGAHVAGA